MGLLTHAAGRPTGDGTGKEHRERIRHHPGLARGGPGGGPTRHRDTYGEPAEATQSALTWTGAGPWKRVIATREYYDHAFPAPHTDSVESVIDYRVPPDMATALAEFDGSVVVERTAGEVSARCHDEQANLLALNLMHDIVTVMAENVSRKNGAA